MPTPTTTLHATALALLLALPAAGPARAAGGAQGSYALDAATTFPVADAVAFHRRDWDGERIVVLLSGTPLDLAAWRATLDPEGAAERFKSESSWIELELQPDGAWAGTNYGLRHDGGSSSGSGYSSDFGGSMKATVGAERVEGRLQADLGNGAVVDLTLAAPLLAPTGDPLPAGGGEPGAAVLACNAAFAARDLAAVRRACEPDTADIIDSAIRMRADGYEMEDPWTPAGASECNVAAVAAPTVAGGVARGDEARVEVAGGWTEERRCAGSVHLRREGGKWRVARSGLALVFE